MRIALLGPWTRAPLEERLGARAAALPAGSRGVVVAQLAEELLRQGHQVELLALDDDVEQPVAVDHGRLSVRLLPRRRSGRGRDAYALERRTLAAAARELDAEVLNPHWSYEYAMATADHPAPRVVTVHDWAPSVLRYIPDPYRLVRLGMFVAALAPRPRVTTPSPIMARRLRRAGLRRVHVVPNGLAEELLAAGPRSWDGGEGIVAVADGFRRLKNTASLLAAMPAIRRARPGAQLELVGPQHEEGGPAAAHARARGLAEGVRFVGPVPHAEVIAAMRRAALLIHPAREESFGMVLIEAMAQGTPVVGGRRSGAVPWVLDGGAAGALVDVRSPQSIARAAVSLLSDPSAWETRSRDGWEAVRRRFAMPTVAAGYLEAYAAALQDGRR